MLHWISVTDMNLLRSRILRLTVSVILALQILVLLGMVNFQGFFDETPTPVSFRILGSGLVVTIFAFAIIGLQTRSVLLASMWGKIVVMCIAIVAAINLAPLVPLWLLADNGTAVHLFWWSLATLAMAAVAASLILRIVEISKGASK
jgi:hypothetical protein